MEVNHTTPVRGKEGGFFKGILRGHSQEWMTASWAGQAETSVFPLKWKRFELCQADATWNNYYYCREAWRDLSLQRGWQDATNVPWSQKEPGRSVAL